MAGDQGGRLVAARYARAVAVTVVGIVVIWHCGYDLAIMARSWRVYEPKAAVAAAWLMLAAVQAVGAVLLFRSALGRRTARALAVHAELAGALAIAAYPPGATISDVAWASNTVGWTGVMLLLGRPLRELAVFLAADIGIMAARMAADGDLGQASLSRLFTVAYTMAGIQLMFAWLGRRLHETAGQVTRIAERRAADRARGAAEEAVHAERRRRYDYLHARVAPLLGGLAERRLDPRDAAVRRVLAIEAARLRRLFAETDDTPHPLLHELRACADVAERRGVAVTLASYGDLPPIPMADRRELAEGPLLVLSAAATWARVTVVAGGGDVVVSVFADADAELCADAGGPLPPSVAHDREEDRLWVETCWTRAGSP